MENKFLEISDRNEGWEKEEEKVLNKKEKERKHTSHTCLQIITNKNKK